ncbi:MAG: shikimate dehydrogenase [Verrucomicrobiales bacterium]|nr:shikimate dehydrogenase [Verrucomicrobiales bacterium]
MSTEPKPVYDFSDLKDWPAATAGLDLPARLSVFGDPVAHSLSPQMHNPGLAAAGIAAQYVRLHIRPEELGEALRALPAAGFIGTNVTIPHKTETIAHMTEVTEVARRIGAVNTVLVEEDGSLIGHNSDGPGFQRAVREEFSVDLSDLRVMILGAGGGAGRAAAVQCAMDRCERLVLVNRTLDKARELATELRDFFRSDRLAGPVDRLEVVPWDHDALARQMDHVDLIVNSTSLGMKRSDEALLPPSLIQPHQMIYDMIYAPARTRLIADALAEGARAANGLSMLLWQGAISFEFWFNREAPVEAMRRGLNTAVAERQGR